IDHMSGEYRSTRTSHACWSPFLARVTRSATNGSSRIGVASFQVVPGGSGSRANALKVSGASSQSPAGRAFVLHVTRCRRWQFYGPFDGMVYRTTLCSVRRSVCLAHYTVSVGVPTKDRRLAHQPHHNHAA